MSVTNELIEEINKFTEEYEKEPTTLKIRDDILILIKNEGIKYSGLVHDDPAIKALKEKYGKVPMIMFFNGIKVEEIFLKTNLIAPEWEIGTIIGNEYVFVRRMKLPEYKFGMININMGD